VNSHAIHGQCNAGRRKKTRFHGTLWAGIDIGPDSSTSHACRLRYVFVGHVYSITCQVQPQAEGGDDVNLKKDVRIVVAVTRESIESL
jgi:hypothetical protein